MEPGSAAALIGFSLLLAGAVLWWIVWAVHAARPQAARSPFGALRSEGARIRVAHDGTSIRPNHTARGLLRLHGGGWTLERLAAEAQPADALLRLGRESGRAVLRVRGRLVEARSSSPADGRGCEISLREWAPEPSPESGAAIKSQAFPSDALAELEPEPAAARLIDGLIARTTADWAQITVWDPERRLLVPVASSASSPVRSAQPLPRKGIPIDQSPSGPAARAREARIVPDPAPPAFRSLLTFPMISAGELLGTAEFYAAEPDAFHEEELERLRPAVDTAAAILRNALFYQEQVRRAAEARAQAELAAAVSNLTDPDSLTGALCDTLRRVCPADWAVFLLHQSASGRFEGRRPFAGIPDEAFAQLQISVAPAARARSRWYGTRPFFAGGGEVATLLRELGLAGLLRVRPLGAVGFCPVGAPARPIGWLMVAREGQGDWGPAERLRIEALAAQAGVLLAGALEIRGGAKRLARADSILRVAELAAQTASLPAAAQSIAETAAAALEARVLAVMLFEESAMQMRIRGDLSAGLDDTPLGDQAGYGLEDPGILLTAGGSMRAQRVRAGDPEAAAAPLYRVLLDRTGCRSLLAAPVALHGRAAGELIVLRPDDPFDAADEEFLAGVAAQLAGLLERTRLTAATDQSLHRRIDQLTALTRIARELNVSLDLGGLLRRMCEEAIRVTGADGGRIALIDPDPSPGSLRPLLVVGEEDGRFSFSRLEEEVLRSGSVRLVRNSGNETPADWPATARCALLVPIQYGAKTVGLLHLHSRQPDGFDLPSQEFVQTMALQVAAAVGNAQRAVEHQQLEASFQRKHRLLRAIHEIESPSSLRIALEDRLAQLAAAVQDTLGLTPVLIGIVEDDQLRWRASAGLPKGAWKLLREDFFPAAMADRAAGGGTEGGCIAMENPALDPDFERITSGFGEEGKRQPLLLVPLRESDGKTAGILAAASAVGSAPGADLLEALETIGGLASAAVQSDRLRIRAAGAGLRAPESPSAAERDQLRGLEMRLTRLHALAQVTDAISETSEPETLLRFLADNLRNAFAVDLVILAEEGESGPKVRQLSGTPPAEAHLEMLLGQNNPLLAVFQRGTPILARSLDESPAWQASPLLAAVKARSFVCFPIRTRSKTAAGALLISQNPATPFLPGDAEVFQLLGRQAATLLENARLLEDARRRLREGNVLLEFSRQLSGLDLPLILQALADGVRNALPEAEGAMVAVWDGAAGNLAVRAAAGYSNPKRMMAIRCHPGEGPLGRAYMDGKPAVWSRVEMASDYALSPANLEAYRSGAGGMVPLSAAAVPLLAGDRILGALLLENFTETSAFPAGTRDVALALADQAALALEKARLFAEMTERTRELGERATHLALLNRLTGAAISTSNEKTLLQTACRELAAAFDVPQTAAALLTPDGSAAVIAAESLYAGLPSSVGERIPVRGVEPVEAVLQTRAPMQVENAASDPRMEELRAWFAKRRTASALLLPLVVAGEAAGLLLVETPEPHPFSLADLSLAQTVSAQLGQALENVRLHADTLSHAIDLEQAVADRTTALEREHRRAEALLRISTELVASLDLELVLNRALQLVNETIGADQATIVLHDPDSQRLVLRAALDRDGAPPPGGRGLPFQLGEGLAGWVIQQRQPVILPDLTQDKRWINLYPDETPRYRSALAVPLTVGADSLGALLLLSDNPAVFNPEQLTLASAAANQVAAAINNAELYRLIRDQAERLGGLVRTQQVEARKSRAMLEAIADGVMVTDSDHAIVLFNDAAERILALERGRVLERPAGEFVGLFGKAGRSWLESLGRWKERAAEIPGGEYLAERLTLDNRKVISVHLAPIASGEEYLGAVAVFRDITQDVEVDRLKSEFVATVSHELRTPMTAIKGYVEILLMGATGPLTDGQQDFLRVVKENTERLEVLVNDLLDVSRIEAGRVRLHHDAVEPGALVEEAAEALRERSRRTGKSIEVVVERTPDLPILSADRARLAEILGNLTDNAFLYTPEGGRITLRVTESGGGVQFDVADTGIGIPPSDQSRIFERFFRGEHPLVMAAAGTGLGLSITQRLVEMHGGTIWMESEGVPGRGSVFHVRLPRERVESS